MITHKFCRDCQAQLPVSAFYHHKHGYSTYCKKHHNLRTEQWSRDHPDARRKSALAYYHRKRAAKMAAVMERLHGKG